MNEGLYLQIELTIYLIQLLAVKLAASNSELRRQSE